MVFRVHERIMVGSDEDCTAGTRQLSVVHACRHPCHRGAVGYSNSLPSSHPYYLVFERGVDLFLNLIDPPTPLFKLDSFREFLRFSDEQLSCGRHILIHCNRGESRAPSLALVLMAKRLGVLPADSYPAAAQAFTALYPAYVPGEGIRLFLDVRWKEI